MTRISIIVPVYNVDKYLDDCIESILASSFKDIEVILIDDGSTDNSPYICDKYCKLDLRCQVVHKKNEGVSAARNLGLTLAKAEFVSFIDGDDFIHPQMLEFLYDALTTHPECELSMCNFNYTDKSYKDVIKNSFNTENLKTKILSQEDFASGLFAPSYKDIIYVVVWNKLYRKNLINEITFKESLAEDTHFNLDCLHLINKIVLVDLKLYYWVQRSSSLSHQQLSKKYIDRLDVYNECYMSIKNKCPQFAHYSLIKIFKTMLNLRYASKNTKYQQYTLSKIKHYHKLYDKNFISSKDIPIKLKLSIWTFSKMPYLYHLFRMYMEFKHKNLVGI